MIGESAGVGGNGNFRVEVADFGPIRRASVDVRPLMVFAGPSNTGKSYLAMLACAPHPCFGPNFPTRPGQLRARHLSSLGDAIVERIRFRNNGYEVVTVPCDSPLSVALA